MFDQIIIVGVYEKVMILLNNLGGNRKKPLKENFSGFTKVPRASVSTVAEVMSLPLDEFNGRTQQTLINR
ncbi:hypothetical protein [uncultured Gimesia sp.]|uniref:hypothetical protein n=1 Tax=uncultured Gimesia sp. TaxID=1678688 RepID=UPI00261F8C74|nr:hypothetical protein [uncultured Gimesia sp.]